jgi:predicted phage tail protein
MLRKIKLYGKLAKFIGHRVLEADVATAAEAVRFLLANWPELEAHMSDQHYRVSIGTYDIDRKNCITRLAQHRSASCRRWLVLGQWGGLLLGSL